MFERRLLLWAAIGSVVTPAAGLAQATPPPAAARLNELGPEAQAIAQRVGLWDVMETVWDRPGATPVTTTGLVAERRMIGSALQELLRPADDAAGRDIKRMDYLRFNRVEGRWDYVSMEMRAAVGIMPAWSFDRGEGGRIDLAFAPFAVPSGGGGDVTGQMLRMTQTITTQGPDWDTKDQFFLLADGTGTNWLAHRYVYKRRA